MQFTELRHRILSVVPLGISVFFGINVNDFELDRGKNQSPQIRYRVALLYVRGQNLSVEASTPDGLWEAFKDQIVPELELGNQGDESLSKSLSDLNLVEEVRCQSE